MPRGRPNGGSIGPWKNPITSGVSGMISLTDNALLQAYEPIDVSYVPGEPYFNLNSILLHGDGSNGGRNNTFLDSSTNALTITRNGTPTQGTFSPFSQTGWSVLFNGSSDYITVGTSANLTLGSGSLTVEFWVWHNASGSAEQYFDSATNGFSLSKLANGTVQLAQSGVAAILTTSSTVSAGRWNHIAVVRNGTAVDIYINGVSGATASLSTNFTNTSWTVGRQSAAATQYLNGYLSNVRILKGTAQYTGGFNTPTSALTTEATNTQLLFCQSNRFIDNSTNAFAITIAGGTPSIQPFSPFAPGFSYGVSSVGGSMYFSGTSDYLNTSSVSSSAFAFGTGDWTVEFFTYPLAFGNMGLFQSSTTSIGLAAAQSGTGGIQIYFTSSATIGIETGDTWRNTATTTLNKYSWNHIALVKSSGNVKLYINGVADSGFGTVADTTNYTATYASIGGYYSTSFLCNAFISNLRVVKGSAQYTTNFTPPQAPLTAITNTSFLLNGTNASIIDSTAKNLLLTGSTGGISTTQSQFGGSSMYFDGTSSSCIYVPPFTTSTNPITAPGALGSGDFTIECWMWMNAGGTYQALATNRNSVTLTGAWWFGCYTGTNQFVLFDGAVSVVNTQALSNQTWYHLAVCRSGTTLRMFVNGALSGPVPTATNSTNFNLSGLSIGYSILESGYGFTGYIDEFRITKYARYTSAFTPSTSAFYSS